MGKRIIFDARVCDGKVHGISRVSEMLLYEILRNDDENEYIIFCVNNYISNKMPKKANIRYELLKSKVYSIGEQFEVLKIAKSLKPDLFHSPTFTAPYFADFPVVINIHDLIPMVYPQFFHIKYKFYYNLFVKRIAGKAVRIITSSICSKNDVCRFFSIKPEKVSVVYNGGYLPGEKKEDCVIDGLGTGFVLFVANEMPHKNFIRSAHAFGKFQKTAKNDNIKMLAVGISDKYFMESPAAGVKNIICQKYLNPNQLQSLYEKAGVLLFPSFYEGFGIPPIEAMTFGVPVISSDRSCIPEVLGDAYIKVNPESVDEMAEALAKLYTDPELNKKLVAKGYDQSKKYSWEKSGIEIINIYKELMR